MKPAQVLDYQHTLRNYLRNGNVRDYLQTFLTSMFVKGGGLAVNTPEGMGDRFADDEIRVLESAYAFHVDAEMMPLIRHASTGLDEDVRWAKEVFPTERGFLMFDESLVTKDLRGADIATSALTWRWGGGLDGRPGVWFDLYTRADDPRDHLQANLTSERQRLAFHALGPLQLNHVQFIPWGGSLGAPRGVVDENDAARYAAAGDPVEVGVGFDNPIRHLYATLALMGQTVTDVRDADISPALKRRLGKKHIPARVVVITLRRSSGSRQPGESLVDWSFRWVTRGHWRKQPCGPGRTDIRVIWIAPYIKGPEGKPLHISEKVYDLRR